MPTLPRSLHSTDITAASGCLFPGVIGFFFVFRACLTFLFFQTNPVAGTIVAIGADLILLYGAWIYTAQSRTQQFDAPPTPIPVRWTFALLALSLLSALWTAAPSLMAALAYWAGLTADIAIVLLLARHEEAARFTQGVLKGAVWGAVALSAVAWCSPETADLRLGNDAFLHPNTLGLEIGVATLIAQHLALRESCWKWLGIALAITLLRTLSKTAIVAFIVAESWYLMQSNTMTRKTKARLVTAALLVVACFSGLLNSYVDVYSNTGSGNQAETLTGRTILWATAFSMGVEKPWFGHGIYSFKALIPTFGNFEPVHAHNELLQQFFEYGITGVILAVGVYWSFYRQSRRAPASELKLLGLTVLIFSLLRGLTDTVPFGLSFPLWLVVILSYRLAPSAHATELAP